MKRVAINPDTMGASIGPFSRAVRIGNRLIISGTTALSHIDGDYYERPLPDTIEEQTRQTLDNIKAVMDAAGGTMEDIVTMTVILKNPSEYKRMNAVRAEFFPNGNVASCTFCADLARDEVLVEIAAEAMLGDVD
jgi:2-iminobutanoate/2-iminopropanoate deaminase